MARLKTDYSSSELCQALGLSGSGFLTHQRKDQRPRRQQDRQLVALLEPIFRGSRGTYGSPRLGAALRQTGQRGGKNRIRRLMRQQHWIARQKRRFRPRTTDSRHALPMAANRLAELPPPTRPNQVWQSDLTYIPTAQGWVYLAVTLDRFSRRVVGWQLNNSLETPLVTEALARAQQQRRPQPGLLHHSDRGVQYASCACRALLATYQMQPSMSRPGNCYDNALVESFFATLKTECFGNQQPLILFRIQYNINNAVKASEGLDLGGAGFELAEALRQGGFHGRQRVIVVVAEGLAAQFPPDQFLRIALRAVGGQPVQREVVRSHERSGPMPAGPVQKHQNVLLGMPPGDFRQIEGHRRSVGVGEDQADQLPVVGADAAKDVGILAHAVGRHFRAATQRGPAAHRITHPTKAGFILKHQAQGLLGVTSHHGGHFGLEFF